MSRELREIHHGGTMDKAIFPVLCLKISIMPKLTRFSYIVLLFLTSSVLAKTPYEVKPLSKELAEEYKLDTSFYKKATYVQDILIATSDKVSDYAHLEAAYLYDQITVSYTHLRAHET